MTADPNEPRQHFIAEFMGDDPGPSLIVIGGIHGNEEAGVTALERIGPQLMKYYFDIRGRITFLAGNTRALEKGIRFIDADLNRHWTPTNVIRNLPDTNLEPQLSEDRDQAELLRMIMPTLEGSEGEVYVLDLHSTSAEGVPFATVGDTLRNRAFAQLFPVTILLGIEEQLEGTLLEYLNGLGCVTLGFEGGQHFAKSTVDVHEALVWRAIVNAGIIPDSDELDRYNLVLEKATGRPRILEVRYRHAITPEDEFEMLPGFNNFDPVTRGQRLAADARGEIKASERGLVLMPLYQKLGEDGFFIGREVSPFWIWLSGVLRRMRLGSLMHFLPGVQRSKSDPDVFEIDTAVARFFPLQIFHLLGFRKRRWIENKLIVSRRKFDTTSPFPRM